MKKTWLAFIIAALFMFAVGGLSNASVPGRMSYEGKLLDSLGAPITTTQTISFKIYSAQQGGSALWSSSNYSVTPEVNGVFSVLLGSKGDPIGSSVFSSPDRYLEITVNSEKMEPRTPLASVGYAFKAADSDTISGISASNLVQITGGRITGKLTIEGTVSAEAFIGDGSRLTGISGGGGIGGSGSAKYLPKFKAATSIESSAIYQDDNGYLGIGTTNPNSALHIVGPSQAVLRVERITPETTSTRGVAKFKLTSTGNMADGFGPVIGFQIQDDTSEEQQIGFIGAIRDGDDRNGKLTFQTSKNGGANVRMVIDADGNAGIGTETPHAKLQVAGDISAEGTIKAATFEGDGSRLTGIGGLGGSGIENYIPKFVTVSSIESSSIYQKSNGFIGINNSNPSHTFEVTGELKVGNTTPPSWMDFDAVLRIHRNNTSAQSSATNFYTYSVINPPAEASSASRYGGLFRIQSGEGANAFHTMTAMRGWSYHRSNSSLSELRGGDFVAETSENSGANISNIYGFYNGIDHGGSGTASNAYGAYNRILLQGYYGGGNGNFTNASSTYNYLSIGSGASGTITNAYGVNTKIDNLGSGTYTNIYGYSLDSLPAFSANSQKRIGLQIADIPSEGSYTGTQRYAIKTGTGPISFGDKVGIGTTSPTASLEVKGITGYDQFRLTTSYTPSATGDSNGSTGDLAWDDNYIYVKTAAGWKRSALSTF